MTTNEKDPHASKDQLLSAGEGSEVERGSIVPDEAPGTTAPEVTNHAESMEAETVPSRTEAPQLIPGSETTAPVFVTEASGTSAPATASAAGGGTTPPGGGTSYPPLPPRQPKRSAISRVLSWPALVFLLVIIIVILFIWGISAHQQSSTPKVAEKTLTVAPIAAPGMAASPEAAPKLSAEQRQELMAARAAYWQHDIPTAIQKYQDLIQQVPNAAFAYGELGNVYYMNGERQKAAESFSHAAMLLIQQNQQQRAASLIPVLGALDPTLAQKVQAALAHSPEDSGYGNSGGY
ncbi:MAG: hypothetical protein U7M05_02075 [Candidatus Igneacidithiobacillus chanchocoensis]